MNKKFVQILTLTAILIHPFAGIADVWCEDYCKWSFYRKCQGTYQNDSFCEAGITTSSPDTCRAACTACDGGCKRGEASGEAKEKTKSFTFPKQ